MKTLNKKAKINLLAAIMISLLFVACGKDDDDAIKSSSNPFSFLEFGSSWVYVSYAYNGGEIDTSFGSFTLTHKLDTTIDFINYSFYYAINQNDFEGVVFAATDSNVFDERINFPLMWKNYTVGKTWFLPNPNTEVKREIVSINETVTTEAGTFNNCIKIKESRIGNTIDGETLFENFWYVRNDIFIIKQERHRNGIVYWSLELIEKNF